jgi:hypothetical protein
MESSDDAFTQPAATEHIHAISADQGQGKPVHPCGINMVQWFFYLLS